MMIDIDRLIKYINQEKTKYKHFRVYVAYVSFYNEFNIFFDTIDRMHEMKSVASIETEDIELMRSIIQDILDSGTRVAWSPDFNKQNIVNLKTSNEFKKTIA